MTMTDQRTKAALLVYRDKCRHFNGIQHTTCKVGVNYTDVRDPSMPGPYRWPCLDGGRGAADTCSKRSLLTQEEHAEHEREMNAVVDRAMAAVAAGKCHVCGADAEPSKVVGRCRYAACGHRVGQVLVEDEP